MITKLLTCPIPGCESDNIIMYSRGDRVIIKCAQCGHIIYDYKKNMKALIQLWNYRKFPRMLEVEYKE